MLIKIEGPNHQDWQHAYLPWQVIWLRPSRNLNTGNKLIVSLAACLAQPAGTECTLLGHNAALNVLFNLTTQHKFIMK